MTSIPFGPEHKDGPWSWGSWLVGIVGFGALIWLATLFATWVIPVWWAFLMVTLGIFMSVPSARAYAAGRRPRGKAKVIHPTVDVRGESGSTYVILEQGKISAPKSRVKPREFGPLWWALYSGAIRAPVHLGDFILTLLWRMAGSVWGMSGGGDARGMETEAVDVIDYPESLSRPDGQRF